jgi:hypothetical protein
MTDDILEKPTGAEIQKRHMKLSVDGEYKEKHFQEAIEFVFERAGVECVSEAKVPNWIPKGKSGKRQVDLYLPDYDVAIELKLMANLRGVGQCMLYRQHYDAVILLTSDDRPDRKDVTDVLASIGGVEYAACTPGVTQHPPGLALKESTGVGELLPEEAIIVEEEANDDA